MSDWGGPRPGAGRPKRSTAVYMKAYVMPATLSKIKKLSFDRNTSLGEVIDSKFKPPGERTKKL